MRYVIVALLSFLMCSCGRDKCLPIEQEVVDKCIKVDSVYTFELNKMTAFSWDTLFIINGPVFPDEVEHIIGLPYDDVIEDDCNQYIFVQAGKIVRQYSSFCKNRYILVGNNFQNGFVKYDRSVILRIKKRSVNGELSYQIVNSVGL